MVRSVLLAFVVEVGRGVVVVVVVVERVGGRDRVE